MSKDKVTIYLTHKKGFEMSGNETSYKDWYEKLSSEEQKKHLKPDEIEKMLTEPNPNLSSLPTAKDFMEARFQEDMKIYRLGKTVYSNLMKIAEEAEVHRVDYDQRSRDTEQPHYWRGRRDEAGHFRDRLLALLESLGK
jgi:hypothetical protein